MNRCYRGDMDENQVAPFFLAASTAAFLALTVITISLYRAMHSFLVLEFEVEKIVELEEPYVTPEWGFSLTRRSYRSDICGSCFRRYSHLSGRTAEILSHLSVPKETG